MAKRKRDNESTADMQEDESTHGVVARRNKRGYREFKDGMLNVRPRGAEVKIFKSNQSTSQLLRLPAELRMRIWTYVLGGHILRLKQSSWRSRKVDSTLASSRAITIDFTLLRVCRQIYQESAILPFKCNIVSLSHDVDLALQRLTLKDFCRRRIQEIQFSRGFISSYINPLFGIVFLYGMDDGMMLKYLPSLRFICISASPAQASDQEWQRKVQDELRRVIGPENASKVGVEFKPQIIQPYA